jgi:hypothetical protein
MADKGSYLLNHTAFLTDDRQRKAENAARIAAKQTPLPEDEWTRLFKLPTEPSRLEGTLI